MKIVLLQLLPGNSSEEQFKIREAACEKAKDKDVTYLVSRNVE